MYRINLKWYKLERQIGAGVVTPIDAIVHVGQQQLAHLSFHPRLLQMELRTVLGL